MRTAIQIAEMLALHRGGAWLVVRGDKKRAEPLAEHIVGHLQSTVVPAASIKWQVDDTKSFGKVQVMLLKSESPIQAGPSDPSVIRP